MQSIFAIDDSASMRDAEAATWAEAVDGQDAEEKVQTHATEGVRSELNRPHIGGLGLTQKRHEHPTFKATPILTLTTDSSEQTKQAGKASGTSGGLMKPFDPKVVEKLIR